MSENLRVCSNQGLVASQPDKNPRTGYGMRLLLRRGSNRDRRYRAQVRTLSRENCVTASVGITFLPNKKQDSRSRYGMRLLLRGGSNIRGTPGGEPRENTANSGGGGLRAARSAAAWHSLFEKRMHEDKRRRRGLEGWFKHARPSRTESRARTQAPRKTLLSTA
jgi:hypothetical protein